MCLQGMKSGRIHSTFCVTEKLSHYKRFLGHTGQISHFPSVSGFAADPLNVTSLLLRSASDLSLRQGILVFILDS